MNTKRVSKVKVIKEFPGFEIGDVLALDANNGIFGYEYNVDEDDNGLEALFDAISTHKGTISKKDVESNLGTYFENITEYKMRSKEEVREHMIELEAAIKEAKEGKSIVSEKEKDIAITVWQNLLWENEWFLGKRDI